MHAPGSSIGGDLVQLWAKRVRLQRGRPCCRRSTTTPCEDVTSAALLQQFYSDLALVVQAGPARVRVPQNWRQGKQKNRLGPTAQRHTWHHSGMYTPGLSAFYQFLPGR